MTLVVVVMPVLAALELEAHGVLGAIPATAVSMGLAGLLYHVGARAWISHPGTGDVLFSDLLAWGFARRCLQQRRIATAVRLLDGAEGVGWKAPRDLAQEQRIVVLERLATDLEARDGYTQGHSKRVTRYSGMIAEEMGVGHDALRTIRVAASVHDVGKLETPLEILSKPGKLTPEEFSAIERHPVDGEYMVQILDDPEVSAIVRHHHERLDGSGYPDGLRGAAIPLGARIVAVADTFDAITSNRSYRAAKPHKLALDILRSEAGVKLDADAVGAFCRAYLARRPFAAWLTAVDLAERSLVWAAGDAVGSGARLAAVAAGTVALGTSALPIHESVVSAGANHHRAGWNHLELSAQALRDTRDPSSLAGAVAGTVSPGGSTSTGRRGARGLSSAQRVVSYLGSIGGVSSGPASAGTVSSSVGAGAGSGTAAGAGSGTAAGSGSGAAGGDSGSGSPGPTAGHPTGGGSSGSGPGSTGTTTSSGAGSGDAPATGLTVAPGSVPATVTASAPTSTTPASVGATAGSGSSPSVGATAAAGSSPSAGVTVSTGGTDPTGVTVSSGGGSGTTTGLPGSIGVSVGPGH